MDVTAYVYPTIPSFQLRIAQVAYYCFFFQSVVWQALWLGKLYEKGWESMINLALYEMRKVNKVLGKEW